MNQLDYRELSEKSQKQLRRQKAWLRGTYFATSVFLFVLFGILSLNVLSVDDAKIMMFVGWLVTLVFFATNVASDSGIFDNFMKKQVMSQVISQEMLERAQAELMRDEKPKRENLQDEYGGGEDEIMELGDDGELVPVRRASQRKKN